jgi:hypothetical protein
MSNGEFERLGKSSYVNYGPELPSTLLEARPQVVVSVLRVHARYLGMSGTRFHQIFTCNKSRAFDSFPSSAALAERYRFLTAFYWIES